MEIFVLHQKILDQYEFSYRINRKRSNILILTHLIIGHRNFFIKVYDGKNRIISKNEELTNE